MLGESMKQLVLWFMIPWSPVC